MRRIILLIAALVCSTQLFAQYSGRVTSTHGTVVEKVTVITIEPEVVEEEEDVFEPISYPKYDAKIGYQQEISLNLLVTERNYYTDYANHRNGYCTFRINYIGGKRCNNFFFVGFGTGLDIGISNTYKPHVVKSKYDNYYIYDENGNYKGGGNVVLPMQTIAIPIYANIKVYVARTKLAPYLSFSAGARFSAAKRLTTMDGVYKYGIVKPFFELALGASIRKSEKLSHKFHIGFYTQNANNFVDVHEHWEMYRDFWSSGFSLSYGIIF